MKGQLARVPQVVVPPMEELGPAMRAITPQQQGFIVALVTCGASNATQAAMVAGYGGTDAATKVAAKYLMRNPRVLAALREESDKFIRSHALIGAKRIVEIALNPMHKDSYKASVELLNRADLIVRTEHKVVVEDNRTTADVISAICDMAKRNNIDPKTLLGYDPMLVTDAQYTDVTDEGSDGLEDLLA